MIKQRNLALVLFCITVISTGTVHLINNYYLKQSNPELLRENITVITSDDASYIAPAKNFLDGKGWKTNMPGKIAITVRSPGYGMIYAGFRSVLSEKRALQALVIFQIFLFAYAVSIIPRIGQYLGLDEKLSKIIAIGVAVMPTFSGFLSYTLTEAITPSLVLIFLYALLRFYSENRNSGILTALILGFLILVRPPMVIWVFSIVILSFGFAAKNKFKRSIAFILIALLPILVWQSYISIKTGELQGLHPIYQDDSNDLYRPLHRDIWNFHKSWGQSGAKFNATVNGLWEDAINENSGQSGVSRIMANIRTEAVETIGYNELEQAYFAYFEILKNQVPYVHAAQAIPGISVEEKELSRRFLEYRNTYIREYPFHSLVVVPFEVYFNLGAHSNLSLYVFQNSWRGNPLMEMLRYFSFIVHFGVFILFPFAVLYVRKSLLWLSISVPILLYIGYLCVIQRGVEERYTLPVLIPMVILVAGVMHKFATDLKRNLPGD